MNKPLLFLVALAVGTASSQGQTTAPVAAPAGPSTSWTFTPAVVSQYMFRGVRLGGASFQPGLEYGSDDFIFGIWANVPLKDKIPGVSDPEIDLYGSYTIALSDSADIALGMTWYHYPRAEGADGFYRSTFEPSIALNYTFPGGLRLTPKLYYDVVLQGPTAELAAFYAVPLVDMGTELDFTAAIGTYKWEEAADNTSPSLKNWGDYWSVGVALPFQVSANGKLTVGVSYMKGSNNFYKAGTTPRFENTSAVGRGVGSISYSVSF